jgi:hypothetical protein
VGTFVGYCVPQLIAVCVLYTEIKISALFEKMVRFITKLNLAFLLGMLSTHMYGILRGLQGLSRVSGASGYVNLLPCCSALD